MSLINYMFPDKYTFPPWQYLIIFHPDAGLQNRIRLIKNEFGYRYQSDHAFHSIGHISAINIFLQKEKENSLLYYLKQFCLTQVSFNVDLRNFGGFPHHTIYINVLPNNSIVQLESNLYIGLRTKLGISDKYIKIISKSHLTIARHLNSEQYNLAMNDYKKVFFESSFKVNNLLVLKREIPFKDPGSYKWNGSESFQFS